MVRHPVVDFTCRFLAQPESFGWSLDFSPNFLCELAYEGFVVTSLEMPFDGRQLIQVLLPWSWHSCILALMTVGLTSTRLGSQVDNAKIAL